MASTEVTLLWLGRLGAYILILAVGIGGLWRLHDAQIRNCRSIEALKKIPFDDLTDQIKTSRTFLKAHPKGLDGFTVKEIERNIARQVLLRSKYAPKVCS